MQVSGRAFEATALASDSAFAFASAAAFAAVALASASDFAFASAAVIASVAAFQMPPQVSHEVSYLQRTQSHTQSHTTFQI